MGILLCEQNFRDVWRRNKSVRAEIGQILRTHTHTHAAKLVVEICMCFWFVPVYNFIHVYIFCYIHIFTSSIFTNFLIFFVSAPLNRVTWSHGAIETFLLLLLLGIGYNIIRHDRLRKVQYNYLRIKVMLTGNCAQ